MKCPGILKKGAIAHNPVYLTQVQPLGVRSVASAGQDGLGSGRRLWDMAALFVLAAVLYFAPTIVVAARKKSNGGSVLVVNLFLGWTLVGWVVALAMACGKAEPRLSSADVADEIEGLERLHDKGIISADEYAKRYLRLTR